MNRSPFLETVRAELRTRHYSLRTEKTYLYWVRKFIVFNEKRHPEDLGNLEIERFLSYLAVNRRMSAATQNQALFALIFRCRHPIDGYICRHHLHGSAYSKQLRTAVKASGIHKRVTAHTFKHSFATQLLENGTDIRTVQELLGHIDLRTTEIYTHVLGQRRAGIMSPIDRLINNPLAKGMTQS